MAKEYALVQEYANYFRVDFRGGMAANLTYGNSPALREMWKPLAEMLRDYPMEEVAALLKNGPNELNKLHGEFSRIEHDKKLAAEAFLLSARKMSDADEPIYHEKDILIMLGSIFGVKPEVNKEHVL